MNYALETDRILLDENTKGKKLLLHSCCAPCSSYVLLMLRQNFEITVFYYNPNITDAVEYHKRVAEQQRLITVLNCENIEDAYPIKFIEGTYEPERFFTMARGLECVPEGGARCKKCFELRLRETADLARRLQFDYFTTTLTISPLKNAQVLNELGRQLSEEYQVSYLFSDFKKRDGYKQSIQLSQKYDLYRQNFCGCEFSKPQTEMQ